ncbi:MAG: glycosyltransferase family 1 protein [Sphingomonadaceae bacterium]|nr:glycosyltransferase family 1 protein [Sphingomonadaceae bacterium]
MAVPELRVALFSGNYNYVKDGANGALNRLVGYLLRQGVAVRVYSPTTDTPAFPPVGDLVSVPSVPVPGRPEYRAALGLPDAIRADVRAFSPTIVHVSAPDFLGHSATTFARELGLPAVASVHTFWESYFRYYRLGWAVPIGEAILRRFYARCAEVFAPSESMADILREKAIATNIHLWKRGVDRQLFRPAARSLDWRRSIGVANHEAVLLFTGRLVLEKGLDVLAGVGAELAARGVPHRTIVAGDGPARSWIEERLPNAIYLGFVSGEALARAFASADIFFNPSQTETFGQVTTEAMASGLPVVGAAAGGTLSLVEDGRSGFLTPPDDIAANADAIERLVRDPALRAACGARGLELSAHYDWDAVNDVVLQRYRAVVATAATSAAA